MAIVKVITKCDQCGEVITTKTKYILNIQMVIDEQVANENTIDMCEKCFNKLRTGKL